MKMFRGAAVATAIAGSMLSVNAHAVNLATDGVGEVAIAPYYTVRDGWSTLINLTNTQNVPVVVQVRLHEALNSRDVLDFRVALSAFDVFTGVIREAEDGSGPVFVPTDAPNDDGDYTCTIPSVVATPGREQPLSIGGFQGPTTGDDDEGPLGVDRLREGYIEFIVGGYAEGNKTGPITTAGVINVGNAIEQHDCAALDNAFNDVDNPNVVGNQTYIEQTAQQFGEPISALKFNFRLLNPERGVEAGNAATTWANFFNPGEVIAAGADGIRGNGDDVALAAGANGPDGVANSGDELVVTPADNAGCTIPRGVERIDSADAGLNPRGNQDWQPGDATFASCQNLITAQREYQFLEPSLNDAFPVVANWWDDIYNEAVTAVPAYVNPTVADTVETLGVLAFDPTPAGRGVDAMSATIQRSVLFNEWSNNDAFGVSTDWVVTQPTKGFYVDIDLTGTNVTTNGLQSALNAERLEALVDYDGDGVFEEEDVPYAPYQSAWQETVANAQDANSCNDVSFTFYDRAEQTGQEPSGGVIVSPAPPVTVETDELCYEANIITFNGMTTFSDAGGIAALNRLDITTNNATSGLPDAVAGWMLMALDDYDDGTVQASGFVDTAALPVTLNGGPGADANAFGVDEFNAIRGLPVIGFTLKVRNFQGPQTSFASTLDHGYFREYELQP